jgi:hypothetical protein
MNSTTFDDDKLKSLMKSAVVEALVENRELMRDLIEEAIEELALGRAIEQGLQTELVPRDEVLSILEGTR